LASDDWTPRSKAVAARVNRWKQFDRVIRRSCGWEALGFCNLVGEWTWLWCFHSVRFSVAPSPPCMRSLNQVHVALSRIRRFLWIYPSLFNQPTQASNLTILDFDVATEEGNWLIVSQVTEYLFQAFTFVPIWPFHTQCILGFNFPVFLQFLVGSVFRVQFPCQHSRSRFFKVRKFPFFLPLIVVLFCVKCWKIKRLEELHCVVYSPQID